jgi:hypothetical protein
MNRSVICFTLITVNHGKGGGGKANLFDIFPHADKHKVLDRFENMSIYYVSPIH